MSLTTDAWSNTNLTSFLGVTAHYIVREPGTGRLILRSGLLAFRHIRGSHTGENLSKVLFEIVCEMEIANRVNDVYPCPLMAVKFIFSPLDWFHYSRQRVEQQHDDAAS